MAKPSSNQTSSMEDLRIEVLGIMSQMGVWPEEELTKLHHVQLGVLRRNATQRHGVTRFKRGRFSKTLRFEDVETVDLHPHLLTQEWLNYARFVLYHEFLHVLGMRFHNAAFREIEALWPYEGGDEGRTFTKHLRRRSADWLWTCTSCDTEYPRKKRSNGKYKCRTCSTVLIDIKNVGEQSKQFIE